MVYPDPQPIPSPQEALAQFERAHRMSVSSIEVPETATLYGLAAHTIRTLLQEQEEAHAAGRRAALLELGEGVSKALYYSPLLITAETAWQQQVDSIEVESLQDRYLLLDAMAQEWDASHRVFLRHATTREIYAVVSGRKAERPHSG